MTKKNAGVNGKPKATRKKKRKPQTEKEAQAQIVFDLVEKFCTMRDWMGKWMVACEEDGVEFWKHKNYKTNVEKYDDIIERLEKAYKVWQSM